MLPKDRPDVGEQHDARRRVFNISPAGQCEGRRPRPSGPITVSLIGDRQQRTPAVCCAVIEVFGYCHVRRLQFVDAVGCPADGLSSERSSLSPNAVVAKGFDMLIRTTATQ